MRYLELLDFGSVGNGTPGEQLTKRLISYKDLIISNLITAGLTWVTTQAKETFREFQERNEFAIYMLKGTSVHATFTEWVEKVSLGKVGRPMSIGQLVDNYDPITRSGMIEFQLEKIPSCHKEIVTTDKYSFKVKEIEYNGSNTVGSSKKYYIKLLFSTEEDLEEFKCDFEKYCFTVVRDTHIRTVDLSADNTDTIRKRDKDSIFLASDIKKRLFGDVEKFLSTKDKYIKKFVPWHRGYLFYGPPGTGKTSLAVSLASEFNLTLYRLSLANNSEKDFKQAIKRVSYPSVLLLEDVDSFAFTHSREHSSHVDTGGDLSWLLNFLDGAGTPDGSIVIVTTNHLEKLDNALTRAGRFDLSLEFPYLTQETFEDSFKFFYEESSNMELLNEKLTCAEVYEVYKSNFEDPVTAREKLAAMLERKDVLDS